MMPLVLLMVVPLMVTPLVVVPLMVVMLMIPPKMMVLLMVVPLLMVLPRLVFLKLMMVFKKVMVQKNKNSYDSRRTRRRTTLQVWSGWWCFICWSLRLFF